MDLRRYYRKVVYEGEIDTLAWDELLGTFNHADLNAVFRFIDTHDT